MHVHVFGAGDCSSLHPSLGVQQIESGTLQYVTEIRIISVSFASGSGLDVMSLNGPLQARTHGSFWNDDGKELLRHQRQSQEDGVHGPG